MNASVRAEALSPSATMEFGASIASARGWAPERAKLRDWRGQVLALCAAVALQAGLFAALHSIRSVAVAREPSPLAIIEIELATKPLSLPPPVAPPLYAPQVATIPLPEIATAAPPPNAITAEVSDHAPATVAPMAGDDHAAIATYQSALLGHLASHRNYPTVARARRQEGVTLVRVTIDRRGGVLSVAIARSSGVPALDAESLDLPRRAAPLPAPPPELRGDPLELVIPVEFFLR